MGFQVTVQPSGKQFSVDPDEHVLDAALRAGVVLPYGCKNGACGSCKGRVAEGALEQGPHQPRALSEVEIKQGMALFCSAYARSDLVIECRVVSAVGDIPIRKMPCRVAAIEKVASDVVVMRLQLPANERLQYLAGQYLEIIMRDGTRRSYSMASAPHVGGPVELHVRHLPGGRFTDALFGATEPIIKERDILRLEGPLGTFFLREDSDKPMVLLASGTGFAPIKAIVEHMVHKDIRRSLTLYWGGRRQQDFYMHALAERWARELAHFRYVPVVSDAAADDGWTGRTGFVHRAVIEDFPDLSGYQVYACGAPIVVESAQRDFTEQCGLPADEFYADSFTTMADLAGNV